MESTPVNWDSLDSLVINFAKSEHLIEDLTAPSSPSSSSASSSPNSSSSYHARFLIRQIRRSIEMGDVDSAIDLLREHAPVVLDDHRILFRIQKQKFVELLRRGTVKDRDSAIQCLRMALAPCALDAYPEAYEEFKHILLALIFDKEDKSSPVAKEWSQRRRLDLAGFLSSVLRVHLQAYDPIFLMTLRYLISIHKVFCLRQGISSPISDLTERLLFDYRDPPAIPQECLYEAPPFDEVDIQALAHAVKLTRQGAVESLRFAKGDLFQAFQNELSRMRLDFSVLDELVREYCVYRGIATCTNVSSSDFANSSCRDSISRLSDGESSINNISLDGFHDASTVDANTQENGSEVHCSPEVITNHEDCSISDLGSMQSSSRRLRRSRCDASREHKRKRWRGRVETLELTSCVTISYACNQSIILPSAHGAAGHKCGEEKVFRKSSCFQNANAMDGQKYEILLDLKEMATKGMVAEVVEEVNAVDPEFFTQNPTLLFQLKQVEFIQLANRGNIHLALKVACDHLGPLAARNQDLLKPLKETLLILLKPNEEVLQKKFPLVALANNVQVAVGRRLGIEEPQLMKIMRATLHTHDEWFRLQMCKDRFEDFMGIDQLKEVNFHLTGDTTAVDVHLNNSCQGSSQNTASSSNKLAEVNSSPSQCSSSEGLCDENAILKVMEFLALPRPDAIYLLLRYNGNAETVIQQIFS